MTGYTVHISYILVPTGTSCGYQEAIHCNYFKSLQFTTSPNIQEVNLYFSGGTNDFKFLSDSPLTGTGFTANRFCVLIQIVNSITGDTAPVASNWKIYDITNQIIGHGTYLTADDLVNQVFKIPLKDYDLYPQYNLNYLTYPPSIISNQLSFGDEVYFFGNVQTDIEAVVYTTDISITLPLNQFNASTNETWDGVSKVYISEIGIYALVDGVPQLVAVGKLNDPVPKDATIARTLVFDIDF